MRVCMTMKWAELTFPPINLWSLPKQINLPEVKGKGEKSGRVRKHNLQNKS